jgi:hypothetical protein
MIAAPATVPAADRANSPGIERGAASTPPTTAPRIDPRLNAVPEKIPWAVAWTLGGTARETYVTVPT